ncbi:tetratricopeptide repeat protein [Alkalilimnicola sp. S0819]|uniref:tetratricopeptide repeat protein n=1 Tax=Alkalilimnicola sp. S0819 TaxID=2613922 RepID=UPI001261D021|nr:tetratricopeptide repeat protein [Alkalilimnicola sp. S0819]KAB7623360.1 sel1 repeat family protein [Alkalilimnicola sp. S0819]MPQ16900.1 sel1 repeat family protein [Alkalilimnicola sp. S0819]
MQNNDMAWNDFYLARRLEWGQGMEPDVARAARLYRRAALRGLPEAQEALAFLYATGQGLVQDESMAAKWFGLAAEQGNCAAQHNLGVMYAEGRGVDRDPAQAVQWFHKAARNGSEVARDWLHDTRQSLREQLADAEQVRSTEG